MRMTEKNVHLNDTMKKEPIAKWSGTIEVFRGNIEQVLNGTAKPVSRQNEDGAFLGFLKKRYICIGISIFLFLDFILAFFTYKSFSINNEMSHIESFFTMMANGLLIFALIASIGLVYFIMIGINQGIRIVNKKTT